MSNDAIKDAIKDAIILEVDWISIISAIIAALSFCFAIFVFKRQNKLSKEQNKLSEDQNEISKKQTEISEKQNQIALFEKRLALYNEVFALLSISDFLSKFLEEIQENPSKYADSESVYRNQILFYMHASLVHFFPSQRLIAKEIISYECNDYNFIKKAPLFFLTKDLEVSLQYLFPDVNCNEFLRCSCSGLSLFMLISANSTATSSESPKQELEGQVIKYLESVKLFITISKDFETNEIPKMQKLLKL